MVINETITTAGKLTFDNAYAVTSNPMFIIALGLAWFIPLLIYLLWGACASARTSDGRKLSSKVISNANFWIGFIIFGLIQLGLMLMIVFPIWTMIF